MRIQQLLFTFFLSSIFFSSEIHATVFNAVASGNWEDASTWSGSGVPGPSDDVVIDGYEVIFGDKPSSADLTINKLEIYNSNKTFLKLRNGFTLSITTDVLATAADNNELLIQIEDNSTLDISGNLIIDRPAANSSDKKVKFYLHNSSNVIVNTNFIFKYDGAAMTETDKEVRLKGGSQLTVLGTTTLSSSGGNELFFQVADSAKAILNGPLFIESSLGANNVLVQTISDKALLQITGNVTMTNSGGIGSFIFGTDITGGTVTVVGDVNVNSTIGGAQAHLQAMGANSLLNIRGNINMSGVANGNVKTISVLNGVLSLGGTINRASDYGQLQMDNSSTLELSGATSQAFPSTDAKGSSTDSLNITNISIKNTSGAPVVLNGPIVVNDYMTLDQGVLKTTDANILIIKDGAGIDEGTDESYVEGPIRKEGSTNGTSFIFPTGVDGVYAPIEMSAVANAGSAYIAQRKGDPPPFGNLTNGLVDISDKHHWEFNRLPGSEDVDITLHWDDISADGYTNPDSLRVVGFVEGDWVSFGNGGTIGSVLADLAGAVSVLLDGDPPPFGNLSLSIGTTDLGALPVELLGFDARLADDEVVLDWKTASEVSSDYFEVERSEDGVNFEMLSTVMSKGEGVGLKLYTIKDQNPYYGANFYRLKMIDKDGTYEYSPIDVVEYNMQQAVSIYPNPMATESFTIGGSSMGDNEALMEVFDRNGKRLFTENVRFDYGSLKLTADQINIHGAGTYMIRITSGSESQMLKLIKIK